MGIFRYPGGKSKLLESIKYLLFPIVEKSEIYIEPFVGGGSVLCEVAKNFPDKKLYINDKDENIAAFWNLFEGNKQNHIETFFKLIQQKPTTSLFKTLKNTKPKTNIEKAYYAVFFNRCTFSGISTAGPIGGYKQKSQWTVDCRYNADRLIKECKELKDLFKNRLYVYNEDILTFLNKMPDKATYLDPPYLTFTT